MSTKVALIGCGGNMRGSHLPRIRAARGVKLVAVCDPDPTALDGLTQAWGRPVARHGDYRRMIRDEDLDAVVISTPHNQHTAQARLALNRGMHVLVEKPLTIRAADAKALLQLARRKRRILHVSYQRHHVPAYARIREMVTAGELGRIRAVMGYVTQRWGMEQGWRLDPAVAGGGMFMDTGSHLVAAMLFLSGLHVREVTALVDNAGKRVDVNAVVSLRFDKGAVGSISTIGNACAHDERLVIHGDSGCITIDQHRWRLTRVLHNDKPLTVPARLKPDTPDASFFRWIKGAKGYAAPRYALEVARISESVYTSAKRNRPIRVAK